MSSQMVQQGFLTRILLLHKSLFPCLMRESEPNPIKLDILLLLDSNLGRIESNSNSIRIKFEMVNDPSLNRILKSN